MKTQIVRSVLVLLLLLASPWARSLHASDASPAPDPRLRWWNEARFGMFVHWGLYSITAGDWEGKTHPGLACWDLYFLPIPLEKYVRLADRFNPVQFDADAWARLAKSVGMKYVVITAKHHDGFCLFDSRCTDFDIMGTPFRRDIIKELAEACRRQGLRFGVYYSILDWHHPDYLPRRPRDDRPTKDADFDRYVRYMKEQLCELLTNYGPISILWFDGEWDDTWTTARGHDLYDYARKLQPDILINNRVDKARRDKGNRLSDDRRFAGDFGTPEQEIPPNGLPGVAWETCMTVNDTWGFRTRDLNWKSSERLTRMLIECASKGGNFLLNIDPQGDGALPEPSVKRFKDLGAWMTKNGDSIYGTVASPFPVVLPWGFCTSRRLSDGRLRLYLHICKWPLSGKLDLPAVGSGTMKAYSLGDKERRLLPVMTRDGQILIDVGFDAPDRVGAVLVLERNDP